MNTLLVIAFWIALSACVYSANADASINDPFILKLEGRAPSRKVVVKLTNNTGKAVRIWDYKSSSWGWGIWNFGIIHDGKLTILTRKADAAFSANIPVFTEVAPHETISIAFDLDDITWKATDVLYFDKTVSALWSTIIIRNSPEARNLRVWTGASTCISAFDSRK